MHIPATDERVELRLDVDNSGLLYLETVPSGCVMYSLPGVLLLGWQIMNSTPDERELLHAHGVDMTS
jgi:hypothetical protein